MASTRRERPIPAGYTPIKDLQVEGQQVYFSVSHWASYVVLGRKWVSDEEIIYGRTVAELRERYAAYLADVEAEKAEAKARRAREANPEPVSFIGGDRVTGDFLLKGFHKTLKTPLLLFRDGVTAAISEPSRLQNGHLLRRLTPQEWDAWANIVADRQEALQRFEDLTRYDRHVSVNLRKLGDELEVWLGGDVGKGEPDRIVFPVRLEGEEIICSVIPTGTSEAVEVRSPDLDGLKSQVLGLAHPDNGSAAFIVLSENGWEAITYDHAQHHDLGRRQVVFGTDPQAWFEARQRFDAAESRRRDWLAERALEIPERLVPSRA